MFLRSSGIRLGSQGVHLFPLPLRASCPTDGARIHIGTAMMTAVAVAGAMQAAAVTLGGTIGLLATTTAVAVRGGMLLIGGDCGYGREGRALPPVAAPESTAVAVPRPVALVPQPAAVAVPGTQPIVADAVPPQPTAVADTTTSMVPVFDMDDFLAWGQFSEAYKQHNAALIFARATIKRR